MNSLNTINVAKLLGLDARSNMGIEEELDRHMERLDQREFEFVGSQEEKDFYLHGMEQYLGFFGVEFLDDFGFSTHDNFWLLSPNQKASKISVAFAAARHLGQLSRMVLSLNMRKGFFNAHYKPDLIFGQGDLE